MNSSDLAPGSIEDNNHLESNFPASVSVTSVESRAAVHHAVDVGSDQNGKGEVLRHVQGSINRFIEQLQNGRSLLEPKDAQYLNRFLCLLARERGARAADVESTEVHEAAEIANRLFLDPTFSMLCVDGRINPTLVYGMIAQMNGGAKETPAGDTNDFARAADGSVVLLRGSRTDELFDLTLAKHNRVTQILDSHLACAAREKHTASLGESVADHGLYRDVLRKREMAAAMQKHVQAHHPEKSVTPMQISYDPHEGYLFMGLETDGALEAAKASGSGSGFTEKVLDDLTTQGTIIHTKELANDPVVRQAFDQAYQAFSHKHDWKKKYRYTALQFWKALEKMRPALAPLIIQKLTAPNGPFPRGLPDHELQDRATLLLSSAFSGYCNNGGSAPKHFAFAHHKETFVEVSEGDFRPCEDMGFSVESKDMPNLSDNVEFASTIVRANRSAERIREEGYTPESFAAAPVAVTVKEIVRHELTEEQWSALEHIDWGFLQNLPENTDWTQLTEEKFLEALTTNNPQVPITLDIALSLNRLREMMATLYDNREPCRELLTSGKLVALPVLTDRSRRYRHIAPFFLKGFPTTNTP